MKTNKRNIQITVRLTRDEQEVYTKLAAQSGTTLADQGKRTLFPNKN